MKRSIVILVPVIVVAAAALLAILFAMPQNASAPAGRVMSIESYVTQNISSLSPEKEVLGGTFYVTDIQAADGAGSVEYEDGHNAYTADFTYTMSDTDGISITSFTLR
jgi:hypothetical protein